MKFVLEPGKKGLRIRREIVDASGFLGNEALAVHGEEYAIVILKEKMTAMELVKTIQSLKDLASGLLIYLAQVCGSCEHCEGGCPYAHIDAEPRRPEEALLEQAGIPKGAKLNVIAEDGAVIFEAAEDYDLRDVSPVMRELFRQNNICLDTLDELLEEGEIIYGG